MQLVERASVDVWLKQSKYEEVLISMGSFQFGSILEEVSPSLKESPRHSSNFALFPFFLITCHLRRIFETTVSCVMNASNLLFIYQIKAFWGINGPYVQKLRPLRTLSIMLHACIPLMIPY